MTKKTGEPESDVVEMDAMDEDEWERDQRTPKVENAQLQKLVKESATASEPPAATTPGKPAPATTSSIVKRAGQASTAAAKPAASPESASTENADDDAIDVIFTESER